MVLSIKKCNVLEIFSSYNNLTKMQKGTAKKTAILESLKAFEHKGHFQLKLQEYLNKDRMITLCHAIGIVGLGTIEETCQDAFSFTNMLIGRGYIHESKTWNGTTSYSTSIASRDADGLKKAAKACGYNDIIMLCNKWAGIDPNDGIVTEIPEKPSNPKAVNEWCQVNKITHLQDKFLGFGFDSLEKIKLLDTQACIEMDITGYARISLMKKIMTIV